MKKNGISLITLIITIIVIIILSSAIILSLNNTNIIKNANKAVESSNMATMKEKANLINMDLKTKLAIENGKYDRKTIIETLKNEMKIKDENVKGNVITTNDGKYEIVVEKDNTVNVVEKGNAIVDPECFDEADPKLFKTSETETGGLIITEYIGKEEDLRIPSSINGKDVIGIGQKAFSNKNIKNLMIPDKVQIIDNYAFSNNKLEHIKIPNSVKEIKMYAFDKNNLKTVEMGNSVTKIGSFAFYQNQLTDLNLPDSLTILAGGAFSDNNLKNIRIPNNIKQLESNVFSNNEIESVELPSNVEIIQTRAFMNNKISDLTIPSSVKKIEQLAFAHNNLINLNILEGTQIIGEQAFLDNKLINITLPKTLTSIGGGAFNKNEISENDAYFYAINENGVKDKTRLISYAGNLKVPVISNEVSVIDKLAFLECNLEEIVIPANVIEIGTCAFAECKKLNKVEFMGSAPKKLMGGIFQPNARLQIKVPVGKLNEYKSPSYVFFGSPVLTWFNVPFEEVNNLEYLNIFRESFNS